MAVLGTLWWIVWGDVLGCRSQLGADGAGAGPDGAAGLLLESLAANSHQVFINLWLIRLYAQPVLRCCPVDAAYAAPAVPQDLHCSHVCPPLLLLCAQAPDARSDDNELCFDNAVSGEPGRGGCFMNQ